MSWLVRHVLSLGVLVFALAIVGFVFTFARPQYRPASSTTTVDMAREHHYPVAQVERAFAAQRIQLVVVTRGDASTRGSAILVRPSRKNVGTAFTVTVYSAEAKVMFGPLATKTYEARLGNVDVSYGYPHPNAAMLSRIKAAVADLQQ
jgi:hypothetical protein